MVNGTRGLLPGRGRRPFDGGRDGAAHHRGTALELVRDPGLSVVLFRRKGWEAVDYARWSAQLLDDQIAFVTPTKWEGETVARLIFLHPGTTEEIVREVLATIA